MGLEKLNPFQDNNKLEAEIKTATQKLEALRAGNASPEELEAATDALNALLKQKDEDDRNTAAAVSS